MRVAKETRMKVVLTTEDLIALAAAQLAQPPAAGTPTVRPLWERTGAKNHKFIGVEVLFPHEEEDLPPKPTK
jgi:hypothetical protein